MFDSDAEHKAGIDSLKTKDAWQNQRILGVLVKCYTWYKADFTRTCHNVDKFKNAQILYPPTNHTNLPPKHLKDNSI